VAWEKKTLGGCWSHLEFGFSIGEGTIWQYHHCCFGCCCFGCCCCCLLLLLLLLLLLQGCWDVKKKKMMKETARLKTKSTNELVTPSHRCLRRHCSFVLGPAGLGLFSCRLPSQTDWAV
jgi:hypothetical protein